MTSGIRPVIRVVIVDDDRLVRMALRLIVEGDAALAVAGEAADGAEAVEVVREQRPDVVLMDIRMPVRDGLSATTEILTWPSPPRIIALTTFDSDDMVLRALRIGAHGFLFKDTPPIDLVAAIKGAAAGVPVLSPNATRQLIIAATATSTDHDRQETRDASQRALSALTDRELQTARAIARGLSNAQIAHQMHVSVATVKSHTSRLLSKLALDNRVQIALLVRDADN